MGEKMRKMARVYNELSAELSRDPTDEEVAERIGWDVDRVKDVKSAIPDATSLNRPLSSLARHGSNRGALHTLPLSSRSRLRGRTE
jgi:DNA-directed RNA polymerase sigma subunit (sigma70/sigma32)